MIRNTFFILSITAFLLMSFALNSQVLISPGTGSPDPSAMLEIQSNSKGLLIPRLTSAQRNSLASTAAEGLLVFDSNLSSFFIFGGGKWTDLSVSSEIWAKTGDMVYLNDNDYMVGIGTSTPNKKLVIQADNDTDTLLEVQDKDGNPLMIITPNLTQFNFTESSKGIAAGFAIGVYKQAKGNKSLTDTSLFVVTPDSSRVYSFGASGVAGGFATGRYAAAKGEVENYMYMVPDNYLIGHQAGKLLQRGVYSGQYNTFLGYESGISDTAGTNNIFVGYQTGYRNRIGKYNIFVGNKAGYHNIGSSNNDKDGTRNIFMGFSSGYTNKWGYNNIYIGDSAGYHTEYAHDNIFIGNSAGFNTEADDLLYGSQNVFIGNFAGYANLEGFYNVYIGYESGRANLNGYGNAFLGGSAGIVNTSSNNTFIGGATFFNNTSGRENTALGAYAGQNNITGSYNVFLGYSAGKEETGSNKLYIENSNSSDPLIYGEFDNDLVGINTSNPVGQLHVTGSATLTQLVIAPTETVSGDDSELAFAEDVDYSYGMSILYDGSANYLEVFGKSLSTTYGPHLRIERNSGATYMPAVYSDGSSDAGRRDLYINPDGQLVYNSSSLRYKENVSSISDISWIYDLRPVTFHYKESVTEALEYGLIAEEVLEVNKDFVSFDTEGNPETVYYSRMIGPIIKALQVQHEENKELRKEIDMLNKQVQNLINE